MARVGECWIKLQCLSVVRVGEDGVKLQLFRYGKVTMSKYG